MALCTSAFLLKWTTPMIADLFSAAKSVKWGEHTAHVCRAEGIDFPDPEISRHRIDDDHTTPPTSSIFCRSNARSVTRLNMRLPSP